MKRNQEATDGQIIRRQILAVAGILALAAAGWGAFKWGEDRGWGNPERAVKLKMEKANQAFMDRNLELSAKLYEQVVGRYPSHPQVTQALTQLASIYEEKGQLEQAKGAYQRLLSGIGAEKSDLKAYTMLQVGKLTRQTGDFAGALKALEEVRAFKPGSDWAGEALSEIGRVWQDQRDYAKAVAAYKALIKEMPAGFLAAEAQSSIGACLEAQGKDKEAIKAYQVVLDKYPSAVWDQAKARIEILKKRLEQRS